MSQASKKAPKKKRKLPKDIAERPDSEVMERLFGKRVMREVKKVTEPDEKEAT